MGDDKATYDSYSYSYYYLDEMLGDDENFEQPPPEDPFEKSNAITKIDALDPISSGSSTSIEEVKGSGLATQDSMLKNDSTSTIDAKATILSEFTLFGKLHYDMRALIWALALPGPEIVRFCAEYGQKLKVTADRIPTIMHVNREARALALTKYTLCVNANSLNAGFYMDFNTDTLLIEDEITLEFVGARSIANLDYSKIFKGVRSLVCLADCTRECYKQATMDTITEFENLDELAIFGIANTKDSKDKVDELVAEYKACWAEKAEQKKIEFHTPGIAILDGTEEQDSNFGPFA